MSVPLRRCTFAVIVIGLSQFRKLPTIREVYKRNELENIRGFNYQPPLRPSAQASEMYQIELLEGQTRLLVSFVRVNFNSNQRASR